MAHVIQKTPGAVWLPCRWACSSAWSSSIATKKTGSATPSSCSTPSSSHAKATPLSEEEGCLSIPGISVPIARPPFARCRYYDLDGQLWEIEGDGLWAAACSMRPTILMASPCSSAANLRLALKLCRSMRLLWPPVRDLGNFRGRIGYARSFHGHAGVFGVHFGRTCQPARRGGRVHAPRCRARSRQAVGGKPGEGRGRAPRHSCALPAHVARRR